MTLIRPPRPVTDTPRRAGAKPRQWMVIFPFMSTCSPSKEVTLTAKPSVLAAVGVPEMSPGLPFGYPEEICSPGGSCPFAIDQW